MPKKQKRTEQEVRAMIVADAKIRLGCADFAPEFSLHQTRDSMANWDLYETHNEGDWAPDCAQAFKEAVARARPEVRHRVAPVNWRPRHEPPRS